MAEHEDRSWSRANVVIAGAGVVASALVSYGVAQLSNSAVAEQRRTDALSTYQAALTTYEYALVRTTASDADWILDTPPDEATPNPDLTSIRVADASVDSVAKYRAARIYFEGAPWLQYCSEALSDHTALVTRMSGFPNERYREVIDSFTSPFVTSTATLEISDMSAAVSLWRDEHQDTENLCPNLAQMSVENRDGSPPPTDAPD